MSASKVIWGALALIVGGVVIATAVDTYQHPAPAKAPEAAPVAASAPRDTAPVDSPDWTRVRNAADVLRANTVAPSTFHTVTAYVAKDGVACFTFTGRNRAGLTATNDAMVSPAGVITIVDDNNREHVTKWNASCTAVGGTMYGPRLRAQGF